MFARFTDCMPALSGLFWSIRVLEIVGKYLEEEALRRSSADEIDLFGRSAFNRYYYATYWIVRSCLVEIDPTWELKHKSVPELLEGQVRKKLNNELKKAERLNIQGGKLRNRIYTSTAGLAQLMRHAYSKRVEADYTASSKVTKIDQTLYMGNEKSSSAFHWPSQAKTFTDDLLNVSKQLGLR
jgi:uncharacterized protein (UPF0332 family)